MKATLILFVSFLFIQLTSADSTRAYERFDSYLSRMRSLINKYERSADLTNAMIQYDMRSVFFKAQSLTRIYKSADPMFKEMNKDFKKMEDVIGSWEKWNTIYKKAPLNKKEYFKQKRDRSWAKLRSVIKERRWQKENGSNNIVEVYTAFLKSYNFGSYDQDKNFVVAEIADQLDELNLRDFDLRYLERGNGLHELRKETRWILHEARFTDGLIQFKSEPKKTCPIDSFKFLLDTSAVKLKYADFSNNPKEVRPCRISQCLVVSMAKAVNDLGGIKDKIEVLLNVEGRADTDLVPEKYLDDIEKIHRVLKSNDVFGLVSSELKACL